MFLISSCSCFCTIYWSQASSGEWRCGWSRADRWCSNYILSDQQFNCIIRCALYQKFEGNLHERGPYVHESYTSVCLFYEQYINWYIQKRGGGNASAMELPHFCYSLLIFFILINCYRVFQPPFYIPSVYITQIFPVILVEVRNK